MVGGQWRVVGLGWLVVGCTVALVVGGGFERWVRW